jgi:DNA primase
MDVINLDIGRKRWKEKILKRHCKFEKTINGKKGCLYICPFHREITPSLYYNSTEDKFICYGCAMRGTGMKLAKKLSEVK